LFPARLSGAEVFKGQKTMTYYNTIAESPIFFRCSLLTVKGSRYAN